MLEGCVGIHHARTMTGGLAAAAIATSFRAVRKGPVPPAGQTIKLIVPSLAGGPTDIVGRVVAERLSAKWVVLFVVKNVPAPAATFVWIGSPKILRMSLRCW